MLKQKSFLSLIMSVLQQAIGFVSVFFVARLMGPRDLGVYSACLAFATMFMTFGDWGYGLAHVKKVSERLDISRCVGTYVWIQVASTSAVVIIGTAVLFYGEHFLRMTLVPDSQYGLFLIILLSVVIGNLTQVFQYTYAALVETAKQWATLFSTRFVTVALKVVTAIFGLGVLFLGVSNLVGSIVGIAVAIFFFRGVKIGKFDKEYFKLYTRFAIPSFFIGFAAAISIQLDKVFLTWLSSTTQVGYYAAAQSLVMVFMFVDGMLVSLLLPTYSKMNSEGDLKGISELSHKIERYTAIPLMGLGLFVILFSDPLERVIFGSKFVESSSVVKILVINAIVLIFAQPYTSQLMGLNKIKLSAKISVIMLLANVALYLILVPKTLYGMTLFGLGANGTALSLLVSNVAGTMAFRYYAFRFTNSKPNYSLAGYLLISVVLFGTVYYLLADVILVRSNVLLLVAGLLALGAYFLALWFFHLFSISDLQFYTNFVNPNKLLSYVRSELKPE